MKVSEYHSQKHSKKTYRIYVNHILFVSKSLIIKTILMFYLYNILYNFSIKNFNLNLKFLINNLDKTNFEYYSPMLMSGRQFWRVLATPFFSVIRQRNMCEISSSSKEQLE